jgi:predicted nicotinamide N-methyase
MPRAPRTPPELEAEAPPPPGHERVHLGPRSLLLEMPRRLSDPEYQAVGRGDAKPFWAYLWPSATALGRLVLAGPRLDGLRVIDLGCGLGVAGFAAAAHGAEVVSADIRPEAVDLVGRNAALNGLSVTPRVVDFFAPPADLGTFDGILGADILYEDGMLRGTLRFIRAHLRPDGVALLADPMRNLAGGVEGAARLSGLEVETAILSPGTVVQGGMALYTLRHRRRRLG